jgi:hypothetical protein
LYIGKYVRTCDAPVRHASRQWLTEASGSTRASAGDAGPRELGKYVDIWDLYTTSDVYLCGDLFLRVDEWGMGSATSSRRRMSPSAPI